ncbi:hypothetical protein JXL21_14275 [Candidatus Bathyarchaeota archaeon]|nr:hypothetical protein [Candidatus Bathyarchaeota archaeon]
MAYAGTVAAAARSASSYRVKFRREEFLELVSIAEPRIIYHRGRMHFFSYDGFVIYTFQCRDDDFTAQRVLNAIEFSNYQWQE